MHKQLLRRRDKREERKWVHTKQEHDEGEHRGGALLHQGTQSASINRAGPCAGAVVTLLCLRFSLSLSLSARTYNSGQRKHLFHDGTMH